MSFAVFDSRADLRNVLVTPQTRSRFLRLEPGARTEPHAHDLAHEVFLLLDGRAAFDIDGATRELGPGQMCVAMADEVHAIEVLGAEPVTMYLSVTPHIQPTHTYFSPSGTRLPPRFVSSSGYDVESDAAVPFADLVHGFVEQARAVADAAHDAATTAPPETLVALYGRRWRLCSRR